MATNENIQPSTARIAGAVDRGRFYILNTSGVLALAAVGADADYIALESVTAAQYDSGDGQVTIAVTEIARGGKTQLEAGVAITLGDEVSNAADGRGAVAIATHTVLGKTLEAAGAAGEIITFQPGKLGVKL